jgi:glycosyltransferase involved in cell wall biosynthesis
MRIVHVSSTFPPALGGMEKVAYIIADMQAKAGHDVSILTSDRRITKGMQFPETSFPVRRLKARIIASTSIMPGLISELLKLSKGTIVHIHVTQAYTPEVVWLISKIRGYRYITHIHIDAPPLTKVGFLLVPYKRFILSQVYRNAAKVVVFTKNQKADYSKRYRLKNDQIAVVPNGVENKFYYDKLRTLPKKPKLLFVGRLEAQKNLPLLIDSLNGISTQFMTTIVGIGELLPQLEAQVKELGIENIIFAGRAEGKELINYFRLANVFVLSSEREGMPLVLLEALAAGLPIVATDVEGNRDVVKHGKSGLLVPFNDPQKFGKAILQVVISKKKYENMSLASRKQSNDYAWERVVSNFQAIYEEALK